MIIDLNNHFFQSFLEQPEYLRIQKKHFPPIIRDKYRHDELVVEGGYVYCKLRQGFYGLKQAARLARDQLIQHLGHFGYKPCKHVSNVWGHTMRPTKFCLCVDDFGVKYFHSWT